MNKTGKTIYDGEITVMGNAEIDYGTVVLYTTEGTHFCTLTYKDKSVFDGIIVFPVMGE